MCNPVAAIMGVSAVLGMNESRRQANKQEDLMKKQEKEAQRQARIQANQRGSFSNQVIDVDQSGGSDLGLGNTFLTGAEGVNTNQLNLGGIKTNLG